MRSAQRSSTQTVPESSAKPRHIAIIMDGNGRWATRRHLPRTAGHIRGVQNFEGMMVKPKDNHQATDIEIQAKEILRLKQVLNEILAKNCNQKLPKIIKDTERDFFMSADESCEYGLIDKVLNKSFK